MCLQYTVIFRMLYGPPRTLSRFFFFLIYGVYYKRIGEKNLTKFFYVILNVNSEVSDEFFLTILDCSYHSLV